MRSPFQPVGIGDVQNFVDVGTLGHIFDQIEQRHSLATPG